MALMQNRSFPDYRVILFDLDGTLTDPKQGITLSVQYALEKCGVAGVDPDQLVNFIGPPLVDSFQEFYGFDEALSRQAVVYYRERFSETGIFENRVYPGIPELLAGLRAQKRQLFVATSKPTVYAERILRHFGLDSFFKWVSGPELDGTRNAKAEVIAYLMERYGFDNLRELVMVGDRKHDVRGAQSNRIDSIGVAYGYGSREELADCHATYVVDSVAELGERFGI